MKLLKVRQEKTVPLRHTGDVHRLTKEKKGKKSGGKTSAKLAGKKKMREKGNHGTNWMRV